MHVILSVLAILACLLLVVGIHEAGHALAAWVFKIKIKRIAIGFGKPLLTFRGASGCEWVWALWPLGGYVDLCNSRIEPVGRAEKSACFDLKPIGVRVIVLLSGVLANLIVAFLALVFMLMLGYQLMVPIIQSVKVPSIAASATLVSGDRIVSLAHRETNSWQDVGMQLIMTLGKQNVPIVVVNAAGVQRQTTLDLSVWHAPTNADSLLETLGIKPSLSETYRQRYAGLSLEQALSQSINQIVYLVGFFLMMMKQVLLGIIPFSLLLGPLGFFSAILDSFYQGLAVFLYFIANFSLAVGLINLLPVPGLDGGLILYALIEKARRKPIPINLEVLIHRLISIAFFLILVQLLLSDLHRFF